MLYQWRITAEFKFCEQRVYPPNITTTKSEIFAENAWRASRWTVDSYTTESQAGGGSLILIVI